MKTYILMRCDKWRSASSKKILGVFTDMAQADLELKKARKAQNLYDEREHRIIVKTLPIFA